MKNILAFDTSTTACSVALLQGDITLSEHKVAPMKQAGLILPMIQHLLDQAGVTLQALDAVAYGCGPGSFTGIRIASSVAQGIGFAYSLPIIQISSLAAIAQAAYIAQRCTKLLVSVDARMEQVYWGVYEVNQAGLVELIGEEAVYAPQQVSLFTQPDAQKQRWNGVGDGWGQYGSQMVNALGFQPQHLYPMQVATAEAVLKLAKAQLEMGQIGLSASQVAPVYLR